MLPCLKSISAVPCTSLCHRGALIAKVKTTPLDPLELRLALERIENRIQNKTEITLIPNFPNLNYWFKTKVIIDLAMLKAAIDAEENKNLRYFYKVVFARVVRHTSNTKGNEFKLFRLPADKLSFFKPNVFVSFKTMAIECIGAMEEFYSNTSSTFSEAQVEYHDSRYTLPLCPDSVDFMLTSPPYGDSRTTVAYGQFSRLALQWLDMWDKDVDRESLGGRPSSLSFEVKSLKDVISQIETADAKRASEVKAFYQDLQLCIKNISHVVKHGGFAVFVVANRRVKGVTLPTDKIIIELTKAMNFSHIDTLHREIPNKRMPLRNSLSNVPGETDVTMLKEHIILLKKKPN